MIRKPTSNTQKKSLKTEIKLRMAHNQYRINNMKETIRIFLKQKYKAEFDELVHVIPKLNGFLIHCKESSTDYSKLTCPDAVMDMDLLNHIRAYTEDLPCIRLMTLEENYRYRNLVQDEYETGEDILESYEIDEMDEDEKEKRLFKPFHDQNIS